MDFDKAWFTLSLSMLDKAWFTLSLSKGRICLDVDCKRAVSQERSFYSILKQKNSEEIGLMDFYVDI